jgi:hypothetical protein
MNEICFCRFIKPTWRPNDLIVLWLNDLSSTNDDNYKDSIIIIAKDLNEDKFSSFNFGVIDITLLT